MLDLTYEAIRRIAITAIFSDDRLFEKLVLKGGNALTLVYEVGSRFSVDLDFSLRGDFENVDEAGSQIFAALRDRFDSEGYVLFDEKLTLRPPNQQPGDSFGGYVVEFKLIGHDLYERLEGNIERMRIQSLSHSASHLKNFSIQISKYEYCEGSVEKDLDHFPIVVYSPEMLVAEKLRAVCQQMPEYSYRARPSPRARDFYDIHSLLEQYRIDLGSSENTVLIREVFKAKKVPLAFLAEVPETREFHRQNWSDVVDAVPDKLEPFDYYFDAVIEASLPLKALWVE